MSYINENNLAKAVRYIYNNIDKPFELKDIATEVGISLSSLKRLFEDSINQTPGAFVRKLRMEMAFRSLQSCNESILEVALSHGFDDQSAFARSFKQTFGYSPKQARKKLNILNELEHITLEEPDIIEISPITIQAVTEVGLYFDAAPKAWKKLHETLVKSDFDDDYSNIFIGIGHDNPHEDNVKEDRVRFTAGVALLETDLSLSAMTIAAGRYARFRYMGKPVNLGMAYHYIYGKWQENTIMSIHKTIPAFIMFEHFPVAFEEQNVLIHVPLSYMQEAE